MDLPVAPLPGSRPLALRFDPATERAFQDDAFARGLRQVRIAYVLATALVLAGGVIVSGLPGVDTRTMMLATPLVAGSQLFVTLASHAGWYRRWRVGVLALPAIAWALGLAALIVSMRSFEVMISAYIGTIVVLVFIFAISGMGFGWASLTGGVILGILFSASFAAGIPGVAFFSAHTFNAYLAVGFVGFWLERYIRRDFVHRTALAREREKSERLRLDLERELAVGRNIQRGFLPERLPACEGYHIDALFTPARQVAGDFYDAFLLPDDRRIGLIVADVCGKGVGAALFMALSRSLIRVLIMHELSESGDAATALTTAVGRVNDYVATTHESANMFATVFAAVLDPETHEMVYVNAGHDPPALTRRIDVRERLTPTGPAVGLLPGVPYGAETVRLDPGDSVLAFTDGVSDARNAAGDSFGEDRLFALVAPQGGVDLAGIEAAIASHTRGTEAFDDVTLLVVSRSGT